MTTLNKATLVLTDEPTTIIVRPNDGTITLTSLLDMKLRVSGATVFMHDLEILPSVVPGRAGYRRGPTSPLPAPVSVIRSVLQENSASQVLIQQSCNQIP